MELAAAFGLGIAEGRVDWANAPEPLWDPSALEPAMDFLDKRFKANPKKFWKHREKSLAKAREAGKEAAESAKTAKTRITRDIVKAVLDGYKVLQQKDCPF
jgi:hypothetical protein